MGKPYCVTPEMRAEIRRLYQKGGITQRAIGEMFGLHQRTICDSVRGVIPVTRPRPVKVHPAGDLDIIATREDARRLARLIPDYDTRSLTARLAGDPIPGDPRRQA
jgi:hypothetical protein